MSSGSKIGWINGWSQEAFFSIEGPLVLPRPRRGQKREALVDRIDWLLAGRLRRLLEQSEEGGREGWTMNVLFLGSRPLSVLWYDESQDFLKSIAKAAEILSSSGHHSLCFVSEFPMSNLRARTTELTSLLSLSGVETLNIWAS